MSIHAATEPACLQCDVHEIETIVEARTKDLGELTVGRVLPSRQRRQVGPFVFFDHMGPAQFKPGEGINVRPHPHINLATVTYLFDGEIIHRDSLGSHQPIHPGAINWMTAGRGITHSERTSPERRAAGQALHGIQLWVALPKEAEEVEPDFHHHPSDTIPEVTLDGVRLRVLAGSAYGTTSPVKTHSPLFYVEAHMPKGASLAMPVGAVDRAAYLVEGDVRCGTERSTRPRLLVFKEGTAPILHANEDSRLMLLGGEPFAEPRHMWWNFVSTSHARIEQAKRDWKEGRFPTVPGDDEEFIPLPDS
jgi:redox-sensitive bicupin YhaK (pirin superfamily)